MLLVAAILASALGFIDGTVIAIAIPSIRASFDATLVQAQWVHNAYMLTLASLILTGGAMGDRFGLARVFVLGIALFVVASLACALSPSASVLVSMRAVQGIGAALMVPGSLAVIARAYPREIRGRAIGIWAAASAVTTAAGPIIGGLALSYGGPEMWRWIFAVNLPLGAAAIWFIHHAVARDADKPGTPVDMVGVALASTAFFCISWGLTSAPARAGQTAFWIGSGATLLIAFLFAEARSRHPMMPLSLFSHRAFAAANLLTFFLFSALGIVMFYLPMALVAGWGLREIEASLAFAPLSVFIATLSARAGAWADRQGPRPPLIAGCAIVTLGYGSLAMLAGNGSFVTGILIPMSLVGIGMALVVSPLTVAVMGAASDTQSGIASGINNAISRLASLIAVAATGGLAHQAYTRAGGTGSFGAFLEAPGHDSATTAAIGFLTGTAAVLALLSAVIAATALPRKPAAGHPPQDGPE